MRQNESYYKSERKTDSNKEYTCLSSNCMHIDEKGCAVLEAYQTGVLSIKELERYRKEMRTKLYQENKVEYKKNKEGFKLGVSKNFRNKKKITKFEIKQIEEQTRLANESEEDNDDRY